MWITFCKSKNLPALDVEALVVRVAHREGLAREDAKLLNRREEIRLVQRRQQEAHRAVRAAQAAKHLVAVNVVNRGFGVAAQKVVQIALERRDGECAVRVGNERRLFARRGKTRSSCASASGGTKESAIPCAAQ